MAGGWPNRIVVVGGGTAGWLAAMMLSDVAAKKSPGTSVTVIESSKIGVIGVGEGSTAIFRQMLRRFGLDEEEFLRETGATIKFGIRHRDWRRLGHHYDGPIDDPHLVAPGVPLDCYAVAAGKPVLYVTERCVFRLRPDGLELAEVAPGIDVDRDILAQMKFQPIAKDVRPMDPRIFHPEPMGLRDRMLNLDLTDRLAYDPERHTLFLNFEGLHVRRPEDVTAIREAVANLCEQIGRRVAVVVNYDGFRLDQEVADAYAEMVRSLEDAFYTRVSRYTTSAFMRVKLGQVLTRTVRPHIFESKTEAQAFLDSVGDD